MAYMSIVKQKARDIHRAHAPSGEGVRGAVNGTVEEQLAARPIASIAMINPNCVFFLVFSLEAEARKMRMNILKKY